MTPIQKFCNGIPEKQDAGKSGKLKAGDQKCGTVRRGLPDYSIQNSQP